MGISPSGGSLGLTNAVNQGVNNLATIFGLAKTKAELEKMRIKNNFLQEIARTDKIKQQLDQSQLDVGDPRAMQVLAAGGNVQNIGGQVLPKTMGGPENQALLQQQAARLPQNAGVNQLLQNIKGGRIQVGGGFIRRGKDPFGDDDLEFQTQAEMNEEVLKAKKLGLEVSTLEKESTEEGAKEKGRLEGISASEKEGLTQSRKIIGTGRRMALLNKSFNEALPSGDKSSFEQRVEGIKAVIGAKTGLKPNPKLTALRKSNKLFAIQIIRGFGEVGNLSQTEQASAIDAVSQEGLTETERYETTKRQLEFIVAGLDQASIDQISKDDNMKAILSAYDINPNNLFSGISESVSPSSIDSQISDIDAEIERLRGQ